MHAFTTVTFTWQMDAFGELFVRGFDSPFFSYHPGPTRIHQPNWAAPQDGRERVHVTSHPIDQIPFPSTTSAAPFPMNVTPQRPTKISHHQTTYYVLFSSLPLFVFQVVLLLFRFLVEVLNDGRTPWKSKCSEVVSF